MSMNEWFNRQIDNIWFYSAKAEKDRNRTKDSWIEAAQKSRNKTWNEMYRNKISEVDYENHRREQELRELERNVGDIVKRVVAEIFQPGNIVERRRFLRKDEKPDRVVVLSQPINTNFKLRWNAFSFSPELVLTITYEAIINNRKDIFTSTLRQFIGDMIENEEVHSFIDRVQRSFVVVSNQK